MADLLKFTDSSSPPETFDYETNDINGYGVVGQADPPGLSVDEMQRKVEELVRKIVIPVLNVNVDRTCSKDELAAVVLASGAVSSVFNRAGAVHAESGDYDADLIAYDHDDSGLLAEDVQAALDELVAILASKAAGSHTHGNITNGGKIGVDGGKVAVTAVGGLLTALSKEDALIAGLDANSKVKPSESSAKIVTVSANKTLAMTDAGTLQKCTNASAITLTIPLETTVAFPAETEIEVTMFGAGTVTMAGAVGVTIRSADGATALSTQYKSMALKKINGDEWLLSGAED